jgi:hypothetical protein
MLATGSALRLAGSLGLFLATESDDGEELGKEALLLGWLPLSARPVFAS